MLFGAVLSRDLLRVPSTVEDDIAVNLFRNEEMHTEVIVSYWAHHSELGVELDVSDLAPDIYLDLRQRQRMRRPSPLRCMGGEACVGGCIVHLVEHQGHRYVRHNPEQPMDDDGSQESELHKAMKDYVVKVADRGGFAATQEEYSSDRKRRTDVLIYGRDGLKLGDEIQVSWIGKATVGRRTELADRDGITCLWTVGSTKMHPVNRAPWAMVNYLPWRQVKYGVYMPVRGGVRELHIDQCRGSNTCPQGKPGCLEQHAYWDPQHISYHELLLKAAGRELVPIHYHPTTTRLSWWWWVRPADKAEYLQGQSQPPMIEGTSGNQLSNEVADIGPKPYDPDCHYREDTDVRREPGISRDSDAPVVATDWTVTGSVAARRSRANQLETTDMTLHAIPPDLIRIQRDIDHHYEVYQQAIAMQPAPLDIAAGLAEITAEQKAVADLAWRTACNAVIAKQKHPWWNTVPNRKLADQLLKSVARKDGQP